MKKFNSNHYQIYLFFAVSISFGLFSCSGSSGGGETTKTDPGICTEAYVKNSCAFGPQIGASSISPTAQASIVKTYFEKEIDSSKFTPLLKASMSAAVPFINNNGLRLFKTENPCACNNFEQLSSPSEDLQKKWTSVNSGVKGSLLGIFIPKEEVSLYTKGKEKSPTVMLRADADKWTLVHEYSHYLYESQRTDSKKISALDAKEFTSLYRNKLEKYYRSAKQNIVHNLTMNNELASLYLNYFYYRATMLRSYTLEESTIELTLLDLYNSHQFEQTTDYAAVTAVIYAQENIKKYEIVREGLNNGDFIYFESDDSDKGKIVSMATLNEVRSYAAYSDDSFLKFLVASLDAELRAQDQDLAKVKTKIEDNYQYYKSKYQKGAYFATGIEVLDRAHGSKCAHSFDIDSIDSLERKFLKE